MEHQNNEHLFGKKNERQTIVKLIENEEAMDMPEYPHCRRSMAKTEKKDLENLVLFTSLSRKSKKKIKKTESVVIDEILQHNNPSLVGDEQTFSPTFKSSRHERGWIMSYLEPFLINK